MFIFILMDICVFLCSIFMGGHRCVHIMKHGLFALVQGMLQTTVITPEATDSDALSTAVFVMGPLAGKRLLQSIAGASAFWVLGNPEARRTVAWRWPDRDRRTSRASRAMNSSLAQRNAGP